MAFQSPSMLRSRLPCCWCSVENGVCSDDYHVPYLPFLLPFFQNSLIKRIKGENVYVKHSNLMLEVGIGIYHCMVVCVDFFSWYTCGLIPWCMNCVLSPVDKWGWLLTLLWFPSSLFSYVYIYFNSLWLPVNYTLYSLPFKNSWFLCLRELGFLSSLFRGNTTFSPDCGSVVSCDQSFYFDY